MCYWHFAFAMSHAYVDAVHSKIVFDGIFSLAKYGDHCAAVEWKISKYLDINPSWPIVKRTQLAPFLFPKFVFLLCSCHMWNKSATPMAANNAAFILVRSPSDGNYNRQSIVKRNCSIIKGHSICGRSDANRDAAFESESDDTFNVLCLCMSMMCGKWQSAFPLYTMLCVTASCSRLANNPALVPRVPLFKSHRFIYFWAIERTNERKMSSSKNAPTPTCRCNNGNRCHVLARAKIVMFYL